MKKITLLICLVWIGLINAQNRIYVNANATGQNDGSSWQDAYTSLKTALDFISAPGFEVWVAAGDYTTGSTDRNVSFMINYDNTQIYGGFAGTETSLNQRVYGTNYVRLNGDVNGNDTGDLFSDNSRNENSFHVLRIANNVIGTVLDNITVTSGRANGGGINDKGAGLYIGDGVLDIIVNQCDFSLNVAKTEGGAVYRQFNTAPQNDKDKVFYLFQGNKFTNNHSGKGGAIFYNVNYNNTANNDYFFTVKNCVFRVNSTRNLFGDPGLSGSSLYIRHWNPNSKLTTNVINSTFVENFDISNNGTLAPQDRNTIVTENDSGSTQAFEFNVSNSVFVNNYRATGVPSVYAISNARQGGSPLFSGYNSYSQDDFSFFNGGTNMVPFSTTGTIFAGTGNYRLAANSPLIDAGIADGTNNSFVGAYDVDANGRIDNNLVDIGAYEYNGVPVTSFYSLSTSVTGSGTISIFPKSNGGQYAEGENITFIAKPDGGNTLSNWSGDASGISNPLNITMDANKTIGAVFSNIPSRYYVDINAPNNGDGLSWATAFDTIEDALIASVGDQEIWIAEGTYIPGSTRNDSFIIELNNMKIYGGFEGTEIQLTDRTGNFETILSGDLLGDDNGSANKTDNAYHVVTLRSNDRTRAQTVTLDGLTITKGQADGSVGIDQEAGAIYASEGANNIAINNCKIIDNYGEQGAGFTRIYDGNNEPTVSSLVEITNTIFRNNISRYGSAVYLGNTSAITTEVHTVIANCLFDGNISQNTNRGTGTVGSSIWIRSLLNNRTFITEILNNTFINNIDRGTSSNVSGSTQTTIALSEKNNGSHLVTLRNNIFWNNRNGSNAIANPISNGIAGDSYPRSMVVTHSIAENNFANLNGLSTVGLSDNSNQDPLFVDANNSDYSLSATSPAIDNGLNTTIGTTDLAGNPRIDNNTVDIGAYEFVSSTNTCNNIVNIPDTNFKNALLDHGVGITGSNIAVIDTDGDGEICQTEAQAYTGRILVDNLNITDLTGIEEFTSLSRLFCNSNQLQTIDVSSNTSLINLQCVNNQLSALDLTNNTAILVVLASNNQLQNLDVSLNTSLSQLYVDNNQLTDLNVANGNNGSIAVMNAQNNPNLTCIQHDTGFDPTSNSQWQKDATASWSDNCNAPCLVNIPDPVMKSILIQDTDVNTNGDNEIQCSEAQAFTGYLSLDAVATGTGSNQISDLTGIEAFVNSTGILSRNNLFTTVDLSQNTSLVYLNLDRTPVATIDLSNNTALEELNLFRCGIHTLDISMLTNLVTINLRDNGMTSLSLPNASNLIELELTDNALTNNIDFSIYPSLERIFIGQFQGNLINQMTAINLSQNPNLFQIYIKGLSDLMELNIANSNNANIGTAKFTATNLPNLNCIEVSDVTYAQNNWTDIDQGISFSTDCSTLSIDDFTNDPGVSIYPIPTDDKITINSDVKVENVKVYNTIGLKVAEFETNEISLGTLSNGVYFLKITLENGKEGVQRIVKN